MPVTIHPRTEDEVISTRVPSDLLSAVRAYAAANDRTLAAEVRRALRIYMNDFGPAGNRAEVHSGERASAHVSE